MFVKRSRLKVQANLQFCSYLIETKFILTNYAREMMPGPGAVPLSEGKHVRIGRPNRMHICIRRLSHRRTECDVAPTEPAERVRKSVSINTSVPTNYGQIFGKSLPFYSRLFFPPASDDYAAQSIN